MASTLTVVWWREIPAQVIAGQGRGAHRVALPERFQLAIDRAAARAGLEAARLEAEYPAERVHGLVATHGLAQPTADGRPEPATREEPG